MYICNLKDININPICNKVQFIYLFQWSVLCQSPEYLTYTMTVRILMAKDEYKEALKHSQIFNGEQKSVQSVPKMNSS